MNKNQPNGPRNKTMTIQPVRGLNGHVLPSCRVIISRVNATCPIGKMNAKRTMPQAMS